MGDNYNLIPVWSYSQWSRFFLQRKNLLLIKCVPWQGLFFWLKYYAFHPSNTLVMEEDLHMNKIFSSVEKTDEVTFAAL